MAPFHPLRHSARALLARAGAAIAVFVAIAVVVLAGGSEGPLAEAEANKGKPPAGNAVPGEQVGSDVTPEVEAAPPEAQTDPPTEPVEPVLPEEPVKQEPEQEVDVDEPPTDGEDAESEDESDADEPAADAWKEGSGDAGKEDSGDAWKEGSGDAGNEDSPDAGKEDSPDAGNEDSADAWDEDSADAWDGESGDYSAARRDRAGEHKWREWERGEPDPAARNNMVAAEPTGGSKDPDPADGESGGDPDEPAPAGRPQVGQPATNAGTGQATALPVVDPGPVGDGKGTIVDGANIDSANGSDNDLLTAQVNETSTAAGSPGGTADGSTSGLSTGDVSDTGLAAGSDTGDSGGAGAGGAGGQTGQGDEGGRKDGTVRTVTETVTKEVEKLVSYVPDGVKAALAALAALSLLLGAGYLLAAVRARRLAKQRRELLQEVGLLQSALLPPVPDKVGALRTSVAYRPADGPGAGGDFYDVLPLAGGRVGFILGDVSGHGRGALARTAFMRYTLRAYLEAGLEPRVALQVAGRVIDDNLGGDFATVLLAVHDPETGSLTYASAGHPAPIVVGAQPHDPVTAGSSPPIGVGVRTGLRQTTVPLVPGSVACLFTDGLMEARTTNGILGRERLAKLLNDLGDKASARRLIESVAAQSNKLSDDMAAVLVSPTAGVTAGQFRTEQLELSARELEGPIARRFLEACGVPPYEVEDAEHDARLLAERFGGVVLHVIFGNRLRVEVLPRNVESIEAASRRVSAGTAH